MVTKSRTRLSNFHYFVLYSSWTNQANLTLFLNQRCSAAAAAAKLLQLYPTLCDPIDGSPPGSKPIWNGPRMGQVVTGDFAASLFVEKSSRLLFGIPATKHQLSSRSNSSISLRSSRRTLMRNSSVSLTSQQKKQGQTPINSLLEQTVRHQCFGLMTHSPATVEYQLK